MADKRPQPNIIARDTETFNMLLEKIKIFPDSILSQIEYVEHSLVGTRLVFNKHWNKEKPAMLPRNVDRIINNDNNMGVVVGDFYFVIPITEKDKQFSYAFVDYETPK